MKGLFGVGTPAQRKRIVYVIDDDASVRLSLVFLLELNGFLPWPFASGVDLLESLPVLEPGCLLLDIRMPQIDGLQVMANLDRQQCDWPVIVMTGHGNVPVAVEAMKLGAIEFIEKPFADSVLFATIARGFAKLDSSESQRSLRVAAETRLNRLSPREKDVLEGLMSGEQNKILAHRLNLSVRTVEMHRAKLLTKLGVRTAQEACAIALRADFEAADKPPPLAATG